jgi:hypothetical protein
MSRKSPACNALRSGLGTPVSDIPYEDGNQCSDGITNGDNFRRSEIRLSPR